MSESSLTPFVEIYTDGACSGNPGPGGWGALLISGKNKKEIFGSEAQTTNNRMEIYAVIASLASLKKSCKVKLYTDSKYVKMGITEWIYNWKKNNWRKSDNHPVKNADLWQNLEMETQKHDIIWCWVKGHAGNVGNEIADRLAQTGKEEARSKKN